MYYRNRFIDVKIEYQPFTYPYSPYRLVLYTNENDSLGTDLGGFMYYEEALIGLRRFLITYEHMKPHEVDIMLSILYGDAYEKALKRWKSKVMGYE